jgi:enamine deaminase RidA (YjgF/YER057c/UK114 family)
MTHHTRIRTFNTRDSYPEQSLDNDLCQAVVANGVVYLRGQVGQDLDTSESVGAGDVEAQAEQAMANIALLLGEAGGTVADIVKVVVYLTDIRYREPVYRVTGKWLKGVYPVSTGIVVSALARPEWLVEIDATAVLGPDQNRAAVSPGRRSRWWLTTKPRTRSAPSSVLLRRRWPRAARTWRTARARRTPRTSPTRASAPASST